MQTKNIGGFVVTFVATGGQKLECCDCKF